jgi:uncharacterized protein (DUF1330 family)
MADLDLVVLLRARDVARLREFESRAVAILRDHGGELRLAFRPQTGSGVDEVHVLRFPERAAFDAYRADPRLQALAALREQAVAGTDVFVSEEVLRY